MVRRGKKNQQNGRYSSQITETLPEKVMPSVGRTESIWSHEPLITDVAEPFLSAWTTILRSSLAVS